MTAPTRHSIVAFMEHYTDHHLDLRGFRSLYGDDDQDEDLLYQQVRRRHHALKKKRKSIFTTTPMRTLLRAYRRMQRKNYAQHYKGQFLRAITLFRVRPISQCFLASAAHSVQQMQAFVEDLDAYIAFVHENPHCAQRLFPQAAHWRAALLANLEAAHQQRDLAFMMATQARLGSLSLAHGLSSELMRDILRD